MLIPDASVNRIRLIRGGSPYFQELISLIDTAKSSIHLQTYIFSADETGLLVADALIKAAARGVDVHLLVDGYASQSLPDAFIQRLSTQGIQFRFFEPVFRSRYFYFGRRLHHKVFVADSAIALVGGINISNHYNDLPGQPAWLDFALRTEGPAAASLCELCWKSWRGFPANKSPAPCTVNAHIAPDTTDLEARITMRRNDWVRRKNQISRSYLELLRQARQHVTIVSSYFIPGRVLRKNLAMAAARGVSVRVILAGMSDVKLAKYAERFMYDWLLRKGIRIYEYRDNILHAKLALCDSEWFTIGSYNVNNISAYASVELNLDCYSQPAGTQVREQLDLLIREHCYEVTAASVQQHRTIFRRLIHWSAYQFFRFVFYLFTFYFKQQN